MDPVGSHGREPRGGAGGKNIVGLCKMNESKQTKGVEEASQTEEGRLEVLIHFELKAGRHAGKPAKPLIIPNTEEKPCHKLQPMQARLVPSSR